MIFCKEVDLMSAEGKGQRVKDGHCTAVMVMPGERGRGGGEDGKL